MNCFVSVSVALTLLQVCRSQLLGGGLPFGKSGSSSGSSGGEDNPFGSFGPTPKQLTWNCRTQDLKLLESKVSQKMGGYMKAWQVRDVIDMAFDRVKKCKQKMAHLFYQHTQNQITVANLLWRLPVNPRLHKFAQDAVKACHKGLKNEYLACETSHQQLCDITESTLGEGPIMELQRSIALGEERPTKKQIQRATVVRELAVVQAVSNLAKVAKHAQDGEAGCYGVARVFGNRDALTTALISQDTQNLLLAKWEGKDTELLSPALEGISKLFG